MATTEIAERILERVNDLPPEKQLQVLEYVEGLSERPGGRPRGTPGWKLARFAGSLPHEDAEQMLKAIEECERIDPDGWE